MKWLAWLIKMTIAALFFTMISLYATWTAVQTYLDKVLTHYQIGNGMQKTTFSDFLGEIGDGLNIIKQARPQEKNGEQEVEGLKGSDATGQSGSLAEPGKEITVEPPYEGALGYGTGRGDGESKDQAALPVWSQTGSGQSQGVESGETVERMTILSTESLQSTKDKLSGEDKMKLFSLLASKLPSEELQTMSQLMEDGITQEELNEMNTIVQKHLSKEEYGQLIAILGKYQ